METPGRFLFTPTPTSFRQALRHSRNPHVIPADAGTQRKTKHPTLPRALTLHPTRRGGSRTALTPPLRKAKGTRAQHAGDARNSPQYPLPQQHVPSPASHPPPPPRGRLRGGPRVRATGRPRGPTTQTTIPITATTCPPSLREGGRERSEQGDARNSPQHPTPKTESSACFPICTPIQNKAPYQHIYGTSQLYFPLSLDSYRAVVLAFSLYKLVSDRRIWTPIKPELDEGIQELR